MKLLLFILGMLIIQFIFPLLDGLLSLILAKIEAKKALYSETINMTNIRVKKAMSELKENSSHSIGFVTNDDEDYFEEEEDDDEI